MVRVKLFIAILLFSIPLFTEQKRLWKLLTRKEEEMKNSIPVHVNHFSDDAFPGSRYDGCMVYGDNSLFLFGGVVYNPSEDDLQEERPLFFGDLWQYTFSTSQWRWLQDSNRETKDPNIPAYFGLSFSENNQPGSRNGHSCVFHSHSVWFYGGMHAGIMRSDLWEFNSHLLQWRVIDVTGEQRTITGNKGKSSFGEEDAVVGSYGFERWNYKSYHPGARTNYCMVRSGDSFLVFGGFGFEKHKVTGWLADLWQFNITLQKWRYLQGTESEHPIQAVNSKLDDESGRNNYPGSRDLMGCWVFNSDFYLFSGRGYGMRENDLWKINLSEADEQKKSRWKFLGEDRKLRAASEIRPRHGTEWDGQAVPGVREDFSVFPRGLVTFLFGGFGRSATGMGELGDLWSYHNKKNAWKWLDTLGDGSTLKSDSFDGKYYISSSSSSSVFHEHFYPGSRRMMMFASATHKDLFYIYGGKKRKRKRDEITKTKKQEEEKNDIFVFGDFWVLGYACFGYSYEHKNVCSGNGDCVSENKCECFEGFSGRNCDEVGNDEL